MPSRLDLALLGREIRNQVDRAEIDLGLDYQANQVVKNISQSGRQVHGFVYLDSWYEVKLDLDDFSNSRCTCPKHSLCAHTVALFAELNKPWGQTASLLAPKPTAPSHEAVERSSANQTRPSRTLDGGALAELALFVRQEASYEALARGLSLEVGGYVGELDLTEGYLTALVVDEGKMFQAFLPRTSGNARCSCGALQGCAHVVAVFAAAYRLVGDPKVVLEGLDEKADLSGDPEPDLAPAPGVSPGPEAHGRVEDWWAFLEQTWQELVGRSLSVEAGWFFDSTMVQHSSPFTNRDDGLQFDLTVHLFVMTKALVSAAHSESKGRSPFMNPWRALINDILNVIRELCEEETTWNRPLLEQRALSLEDRIRSMIIGSSSSMDGPLWAFHMLWNAYFPIQHAARERSRLLQAPWSENVLISLALMHILALMGDDEGAEKILGPNFDSGAADHILELAEGLMRLGEIVRAAKWLHRAAEEISVFTVAYASLIKIWESLSAADATEMEMLETRLRQDLPRSISEFVAHFIRVGKPNEAFGALMATGQTPNRVPEPTLDRLWEDDAERSLAWYHQACDELVRLKRRDAYAEAGTLLVTLRQKYRKMGRGKEWDLFLKLFFKRYGRLKALHEELKRKRIIFPQSKAGP